MEQTNKKHENEIKEKLNEKAKVESNLKNEQEAKKKVVEEFH